MGENTGDRKKSFFSLFAPLGVVFGDIGTSPLYTIRESVGHLEPTKENVLGILSLVFYSLLLIVTVKYVFFVLRADHKGEGGIFALQGVLTSSSRDGGRWLWTLPLSALGASFLLAEGAITPAISVLSAVEGLLTFLPPSFPSHPLILTLTVGILFALFQIQKRGTGFVSQFFSPIMFFWFLAIGGMGIFHIVREPAVLSALDPRWFFSLLREQGFLSFALLGSVFLAVTGAEALYADLGHFGKKTIRSSWLYIVFPSLLLNYFGQGAILLKDPSTHPFWGMVESTLRIPLIILATTATVIASQALITGSYSLVQQAIHLSFLPRMRVEHTSETLRGRIYLPFVNSTLMVLTIFLVLFFQSSSSLAHAYGISVSSTMVLTTLLFSFFLLIRKRYFLFSFFFPLFFFIDFSYLVANFTKFFTGGWFTVFFAGLLFVCMDTWRRGRSLLREYFSQFQVTLDALANDLSTGKIHRVEGIAVFMNSNPGTVPQSLLHHLKHNQVLHSQVLSLTFLLNEEEPRVDPKESISITFYGEGIFQVTVSYGYMDTPSIDQTWEVLRKKGVVSHSSFEKVTFFLGRETLIPSYEKNRGKISMWRKKLFVLLSRLSLPATHYYQLPPGRVVEIGTQIEF